MSSIIITITNKEKSFFYDFDVPVDLAVDKLIQDLIETINGLNPTLLLRTYGSSLYCRRLKQNISPEMTLEEFGVRNGDYLILNSGGSEDQDDRDNL